MGRTERWDRGGYPERGPRDYWTRYPQRDRPSDMAVALVCVLAIAFLGLCAWAGMTLVQPSAQEEETELPTHRVTHDSMCATNTYDGELIRWYVMTDPDYQIQYLVNDRGGCCVRLDSEGNVMSVADKADDYDAYGEGGSYE